jgi:hypothetical protein
MLSISYFFKSVLYKTLPALSNEPFVMSDLGCNKNQFDFNNEARIATQITIPNCMIYLKYLSEITNGIFKLTLVS